jgi:hypothetical protein
MVSLGDTATLKKPPRWVKKPQPTPDQLAAARIKAMVTFAAIRAEVGETAALEIFTDIGRGTSKVQDAAHARAEQVRRMRETGG